MKKVLALLSICCVPLFGVFAEPVKEGPVLVEMVQEEQAIAGGSFWAAFHLKIDPSWHLYWKNPGDAGAPIALTLDKNDPFEIEEVKWPTPHRFELGDMVGFGYEEEVTLLAKIGVKEGAENSSLLHASVQFVACSDECTQGIALVEQEIAFTPITDNKGAFFEAARSKLPTSASLSLTKMSDQVKLAFDSDKPVASTLFYPAHEGMIPLSASPTLSQNEGHYEAVLPLSSSLDHLQGILVGKDSAGKEVFAFDVDQPIALAGSESMLMPFVIAALAAFAGGVLLNLMPCVLPVLSLKVLSVVHAAGSSVRARVIQGVAYLGGVLASFWALTTILLAVKASGSELGWGFQLQEPIFVGMLALLLFVMALNFFGVFEFGTSLISLDQKAANKKTAWGGSFLSGVLATVVATPCTGPFLGAALGFAMTLPWFGTLFLFTVMALGMALPFFLLTLFPGLLRFLPKPGQWMVVMKQFFGFILLATTLWLIWVFEAETGFTMVIWLLAALLVISLGAWIYGSFAGFGVSKRRRFITNILCTLLAAGAISMVATHTEAAPQTSGKELAHSASSWEPFSEKRLQELRAAGTPVFIDFTAKWCLICQANKAVLHSKGVEEAFEKTGTVRMIADWTRGDKEITAMLKEFNRTGVPLYVLYGANKTEKPYVFSETLTPETVIAQLNS